MVIQQGVEKMNNSLKLLAALLLIAPVIAGAEITTMRASFDQCQQYQRNIVADLGIKPSHVRALTDDKYGTDTVIYTSDGQVLITCSRDSTITVMNTSTERCR